ncbi:MAG: ribose ABC transporter substrate-binding protein RbsB [Chloroflexota bacterium]
MAYRLLSRTGWSTSTLRLMVVIFLLGVLCTVPRYTASASTSNAGPPFTIGVSNNTVGNGWRDEMVCSIRAEVQHSGKGKTVIQQGSGDTSVQIAQIRNLISQHVNAIIVDPNSTALSGAIQQAASRGIIVVIVDQFIPSLFNKPNIYQAANNQRAYGRLGMQWLVRQIHGKGNVALLEGIAGAPANTERELGQQDVLKHFPNIHTTKVYTGWDYTKGGQQMTQLLNSGKKIDGVWTSGIDYTIINAYRTAHRKFVPVVGADNNEFVHQLTTMRSQGVIGAAVTNPPPIGGVGAAIALRALSGGHPPAVTTLTPKVWANNTASGLSALRAHYLPTRGPTYGADWIVKAYANYTKSELFGCSG